MKKKLFVSLLAAIPVFIYPCSVFASSNTYSSDTFSFTYDDETYTYSESTSDSFEQCITISAINMPDDGGGHNTVLACFAFPNTEYATTASLSPDDLLLSEKTFASNTCQGLFEIDPGITLTQDSYNNTDTFCEYTMSLSDGTECYTKVFEYDQTIYYAVCRLCPYTADLNDGFHQIYDSISLAKSGDSSCSTASDTQSNQNYWQGKYDDLQKEHGELITEHNTLQNDYSSLQKKYDELSQQYDELQEQLNELSNASSNFSDDPIAPIETDEPVSEEEANEEPAADTTTIFSTDAVSFYKDRNNYYTVQNMIKADQIEELKAQLNNYASIRPDDKSIIDSTLDVLNQYGDFENIICESDAVTHDELYYYNGYHGIDSEHYIYPYWELNALGFHLRLGFTNSDWIFTTNIYLKRDADGINDGIWFYGNSNEFERTVLDSGGIMEYKDEEVSGRYVDYLLGDLSAPMTLRFQSDSDAKLDYVLTDTDKQALQNLAKFTKLLDSIADLSH